MTVSKVMLERIAFAIAKGSADFAPRSSALDFKVFDLTARSSGTHLNRWIDGAAGVGGV